MLVALEVAGFKSFADRTRFNFPDGITVIVGPNGSGKSNVVDAIKWVLGAQSAKALRGQDMADVIFKGSAGSGRKPANSAEATLVFDNSTKTLPIDEEEVQITRRVYRNGDSEYLINGQASRLKDIKNLFRGTGVGVDAYSLIEQGKVDRMLQASPKDRRLIFEEAAGISRFNAKKAEAERRLQRVDHNLVRLKDIVDEVSTHLNQVKSQASKAQQYRQMTTRLHEIRLRLGWTEYSQLQSTQQQLVARQDQIVQQQQSHQLQLTQARSQAHDAEMHLHQVAQRCQSVEGSLQNALQRIAVAQNQQLSLAQRIDEASQEWSRQTVRLGQMLKRQQEEAAELFVAQRSAATAEHQHSQARSEAEASQARVEQLRTNLNACAASHDSLRKEHVRLLREASDRAGQIAEQRNLLGQLLASIQETQQALQDNLAQEQSTRKTADRSAERLKAIHHQHQQVAQQLASARDELETNRDLLSKLQAQSAVLQGRLEGANSRLEILQELQRHYDGVDAGARHLLNQKSAGTDPALQSIYGLVADLIQVEVGLAPLIDTALGQAANALVLTDGQLIHLARSGKLSVPGRLMLMRMDRVPTSRFGEKVQLEGVAGVMGRADRMIKYRREVQPLMRYLLGTTWLVQSLEVALELGHFRGAGLRFVTHSCELIEADGTITLGSLSTSSGLVSRRSEIENSLGEIAEGRHRFQKLQGEIERVQSRIRHLLPSVHQLEANATELAQELAHHRSAAQSAATRLDEIEKHAQRLQENLTIHQRNRAQVEPMIAALMDSVTEGQLKIDSLDAELSGYEAALQEFETQFAQASQDNIADQVNLARAEQVLQSASSGLQQCQRHADERQLAVNETRAEIARLESRRCHAELEILQLTSQLAEDYCGAEAEEAQLEQLAVEARILRQRRAVTAKHLESVTRTLDKLNQQLESVAGELERSRQAGQSLLQRFADDYQIHFDSLQSVEIVEDAAELSAMNAEATRLRQDISSVGEINMTALAELDALQARHDHLDSQYQDLVAAKESLQRIIHKINGDSRRLFLETLEAIRGNFQKLYRKSFGGGHADIVLEDGADVLECGIDIVATPPGKTSFSNSLLSGGEKALTAVALLLAIFQYRPSPFCVLDEVDAPFDEANIGRFVQVLSEFLDWTKFIVVTHSKKTMTAANTLYGVTMQESGVSKQVAVRFEDVNDKGEIVNAGKATRRAA
ncbi:MAG: chromosome segregation protein SMC [Pirellulaceae bacterium]|nr:chromosome segregation protein SMC [Pirellulaceae bacterium]